MAATQKPACRSSNPNKYGANGFDLRRDGKPGNKVWRPAGFFPRYFELILCDSCKALEL